MSRISLTIGLLAVMLTSCNLLHTNRVYYIEGPWIGYVVRQYVVGNYVYTDTWSDYSNWEWNEQLFSSEIPWNSSDSAICAERQKGIDVADNAVKKDREMKAREKENDRRTRKLHKNCRTIKLK